MLSDIFIGNPRNSDKVEESGDTFNICPMRTLNLFLNKIVVCFAKKPPKLLLQVGIGFYAELFSISL